MKTWHRILFIILSATLATLTFEPYALSHLALVTWIPFFITLRGVSTRAGFRLGLLQGFLTLAGTLPWLHSVFGTLAPVLWFILALFTGLFGALSTLPRLKNSPFLLAVIWTGLEYYRCEHFYLSFPWITPGTGFDPNFFTMIIGVYGVTFLIVLGSIMLAQKRYNTGTIILITIILFWVDSDRPKIETPLTVALVQNESMNYDNYLIPSKPLKDQADFIVWPEYAINFDPTHQTFALKQIDELLDARAQLLVSGGQTWHDISNEIYSNTAFIFGTEGILGSHFKNHTVHFFSDGEKGTTAKAVETPFGKIGTPICFDCDHQDVVRKMTADGAEFFLIPSLDKIAWTERQHLQHGQLFRHRAAENGRWLAIASTSGLTQIIDPKGHTRSKLPIMEEGILIGEIEALQHQTLFQRGGWVFGPVCLAGTVIISLFAIRDALAARRRKRASETASPPEFPDELRPDQTTQA